LHVHDRLERHPRGLVLLAVLTVLRFICANPECRATWRVLPAFLARRLWWGWEPIARAIQPEVATPTEASSPPARTRQRWMARLSSSARQLVLLASRGTKAVRAVAERIGVGADRMSLVKAAALAFDVPGLWQLAALVDRLGGGFVSCSGGRIPRDGGAARAPRSEPTVCGDRYFVAFGAWTKRVEGRSPSGSSAYSDR
jgi:hypothetical protein